MTLRKKTILITSVTIAIMVAFLFIASGIFMRYSVRVREEDNIRVNVERASGILNDAISDLDVLCNDWASWNDAYDFIEGLDEDFVENNIVDDTFQNTNLNLICFVNPDSSIYFCEMFDFNAGHEIPIPQSFLDQLKPGSPFLTLDIENGSAGILNLPEGILMIDARTILTSEGEGPPHGTLIMGRYLTESEMGQLSDISRLALSFSRIGEPPASPDMERAQNVLPGEDSEYIERLDEETIAGYTTISDFHGNPAMVLKVAMPRTAYMEAQAETAQFSWLIFIVGTIFGIVMLIFQDRLILSKLSRLTQTFSMIRAAGDFSARVDIKGTDELGFLGSEINKTLDSLEASKSELLNKSVEFQNLVENQGEGIVIIDPKGNFTFANPAAHEIFGFGNYRLVGNNISIFTGPENKGMVQYISAECRKGKKATVELEITRPSGESRTLLITATPSLDKDNNYIGTFAIFRDITERKKTEKLKASLDAKSEFLSMVSHELRTPLVPIMGYSDLMLSGTFGEIPDDFREPLNFINSSAESLKNLIDDLLEINQMDRGTLRIVPGIIKIESFLQEIIKPYAVVNRNKPVSISLECENFKISVDSRRLSQIIRNLVNNSIKYSGKRVDIHVRTYKKDGKGCISLHDNGIGISKEELPNIFNSFYQVEEIITRHHGGAGLGLAIVKNLTEAMNGTVAVESELGKGSTFTIAFPLYKSADIVSPEITDEAEYDVAELDRENRPFAHVLVIDDDIVSQKIIKKFLEMENYKVSSATSGNKGIEITRDANVDLILLDWMMPGTDGLSILISLKADVKTRDIPVIFVSGMTAPESIGEGIKAGAIGFINKPFKKVEIINSIAKALETNSTKK
ncbi:MAG: ATP-binding protein [bacterium]|nr:ATP-binding protein [bacterium]